MSSIPTINDLLERESPKGKVFLVRVDLNVPIAQGKVADFTRITRIKPTIDTLQKVGAKIVLLSHFGRPEGKFDLSMSLAPIVDALAEALGIPIQFGVDCIGKSAHEAIKSLEPGGILLLENLRFYNGEEENDLEFAKELASLGDYYINDAFSCSHRAHASITSLAEMLPSAAGYLLFEEVSALEKHLSKPERPMAALIGGAKISTKIDLLNRLVQNVEVLAIGGAMANTFLEALGYSIGTSLYEKNYIKVAKNILELAKANNTHVILPSDVVIAKELKNNSPCLVVNVDGINKDMMALDIGPHTVSMISQHVQKCKTVIWNGPFGAYEYRPFDIGTISIARMIANLSHSHKISSIAGGGDVVAAISSSGLFDSFSYISTAGGAFLEWLEGKELPGIAALKKHAMNNKTKIRSVS